MKKTQYCPQGHNKDATGRTIKGACLICKKENNFKWNLKQYGLTPPQYNQILKEQNYLCLGCERHQSEFPERFHVDHNHRTGRIRGLLCGPCNMAIGLLSHNVKTLKQLAIYLS